MDYLDADKGMSATYEYAIVAKDDAGHFSERGKGLRLRMMSMGRLGRIKGLKVQLDPSTKVARLTWEQGGLADNSLIILRSTDNGTFREVERLSADRSEWSDRPLKPGSTYRYTMQAIDQRGQGSDYAAEVTLRP